MRIMAWSSAVCSSDLVTTRATFLCLCKETWRKESTPRLRARCLAPGSRSRRDFPRGHPAPAENAAHPCAAPLRVLVRRLRRCGGVPEGQVQDQRQRHRLLLALQERRKSRAFALLLQERLWREAQAGPGLALRPDAARNRATPSHEWRRRAGIGPL